MLKYVPSSEAEVGSCRVHNADAEYSLAEYRTEITTDYLALRLELN
jgi:hypothetical protein